MNGISHRSLGRGGQLEATLEQAATLGFTAVEHVRPAGESGSPHPARSWYRQRRIEVLALSEEREAGAPEMTDGDARGRAWQARVLGLRQTADALGCRTLLVPVGLPASPSVEVVGDLPRALPSRARLLDQVCRNLHAVLGQLGEHRLALVPVADPAAVPGPAELSLVLEDLRSHRLGYCHATDVCARLEALGAPGEAWLEADRGRLWCARVAEMVGERTGELPGMGGTDWRAVGASLRGVPTILDVRRELSREELLVVQRFAEGVGL